MEKKAKERRRHPRLSTKLPFRINGRGLVITTQTKNISCSGAYCAIDKAIAPMSKIRCSLEIPTIRKGRICKENITCGGIIVRCDPSAEQDTSMSANTAIMFTGLSRRSRSIINRYVKYQLTKLRCPKGVL